MSYCLFVANRTLVLALVYRFICVRLYGNNYAVGNVFLAHRAIKVACVACVILHAGCGVNVSKLRSMWKLIRFFDYFFKLALGTDLDRVSFICTRRLGYLGFIKGVIAIYGNVIICA